MQQIGMGRQTFLQQLATIAELLGDRLRHCEVCRPPAQTRPVLLVVAEGDLSAATACAERVCADWFGGMDAAHVPDIEVVGRFTYETLKRLTARGVLARAVLLLARAYALQRGIEAPQDVREALGAAFAGLWGDTLDVLGELLEEGGSSVAVARALMPKFGG